MALTHEDIGELKKTFDERYVQVKDCNDVQLRTSNKFSNDDKRIELLVRQQTINNWLTGAIASGIITLLIKVFLGG